MKIINIYMKNAQVLEMDAEQFKGGAYFLKGTRIPIVSVDELHKCMFQRKDVIFCKEETNMDLDYALPSDSYMYTVLVDMEDELYAQTRNDKK